MPPSAIPLAAIAGQLARHVWLSRKRLTYVVQIDMPAGLRQEHPAGTGPVAALEVITAGQCDGSAGGGPAGTRDAWLVVLAITNSGLTPIRAGDFTAPLAFGFPGREIHAAQIQIGPTARENPGRPPQMLADPDRIELGGGFRLNRGDELTLMVVLTGQPPRAGPPVRHEGTLARGTITTERQPPCLRSATLPPKWFG